MRTYEKHKKIIHWKLKCKKQKIMYEDLLKKYFFWQLNFYKVCIWGVGLIVDFIIYHVTHKYFIFYTHKYFKFCFIFHIISTSVLKLQQDLNSIPRYRMASFTYRLWSVNCNLPEIRTIWACLLVTCEEVILLWKCN